MVPILFPPTDHLTVDNRTTMLRPLVVVHVHHHDQAMCSSSFLSYSSLEEESSHEDDLNKLIYIKTNIRITFHSYIARKNEK